MSTIPPAASNQQPSKGVWPAVAPYIVPPVAAFTAIIPVFRDFTAPKWGKESVALAFIDGKKAGVGRLVPLENGGYELGGIFVLPEFRKRGIANLVENAPAGKSIYCLPFEHLREFYGSFGFKNALFDNTVPSDIREKHSWCLASYSEMSSVSFGSLVWKKSSFSMRPNG